MSIKSVIYGGVGHVTRFVKSHGADIMHYTGMVGVGATAYFSGKNSVKASPVIKDFREKMAENKNIEDKAELRKKNVETVTSTAAKLGKIYIPTIIAGGLTIVSLEGGHVVLKKRNAALVAFGAALAESFNEYRKRVVEDQGAEKDFEYMHGVEKATVNDISEDAENDGGEVLINTKSNVSIYSRFFDQTNPNWTHNSSLNIMFLRRVQDEVNWLLKAKGHLFLNEVYDKLGMSRSEAGQFVGWVRGHGDGVIDFGIYDIYDTRKQDFINGYEPAILLDFNVDGDIMYILKKDRDASAKEEMEKVEKWRLNHE